MNGEPQPPGVDAEPAAGWPPTPANRLTAAALRWLAARAQAPLPRVRRWGGWLGVLSYWLVARRRRIVRINLRLCFPDLDEAQRRALAKAHFRYFAQSVLDRFVLWNAPAERIRALVHVHGEEHLRAVAGAPVILLAPHFVGLDAGGTRLTLDRHAATVFARQKNPVVNEVMRAGRARFNDAVLVSRLSGLRGIVRLVRSGVPLYFLPDMDLGARDAVWVPFFGVPAATVTSVARIARMTGARIVPLVTQMTDDGYVARFHPAWDDFPGDDLHAATARMNAFIEQRVLEMPAQYLWSHKRFKTRPPGEPGFYDGIRGRRAAAGRAAASKPAAASTPSTAATAGTAPAAATPSSADAAGAP